ncbi:MAG: diguanylate cyclase [Candidatus Omnitrophota bacterium]
MTKILISNKHEMLSLWLEQIKSLGGSYVQVDPVELRKLCIDFFESLVEILEKENFLKLRMFIEKISKIRSTQGFRLSEVQRAYYSFYNVTKSFMEKQNSDKEIKEALLEKINNILIETLFELSESYYKRLNEKIDKYIGEVEAANFKLQDISIQDELTGCYNYRYFQDILDIEIPRSKRYNRPLSIIMFDIDHFKNFNDKFGHLFGDEVLKLIGGIMKQFTRSSDAVFRYGGEEFSIILPETKKEEAFIIAERIREKIQDTSFKIQNIMVNITLSGGVSQFDNESSNKDSFIANADKALYLSKDKGRNRIEMHR